MTTDAIVAPTAAGAPANRPVARTAGKNVGSRKAASGQPPMKRTAVAIKTVTIAIPKEHVDERRDERGERRRERHPRGAEEEPCRRHGDEHGERRQADRVPEDAGVDDVVLQQPQAEPVAFSERGLADALAVHERAVRAVQVLHFELASGKHGQAAVDA